MYNSTNLCTVMNKISEVLFMIYSIQMGFVYMLASGFQYYQSAFYLDIPVYIFIAL